MIRLTSRDLPPSIWNEIKIQAPGILKSEVKFSETDYKNSDIHIEFNFDKNRNFIPSNLTVLILWEPISVMPLQYTRKILSKFDLVVPASPWRAEKLKFNNWIYHTYNIGNTKFSDLKRTKNIAMINAAKFSANKNSLYGFRRKASRYLHKNKLSYDLFGQNWNMSKIKEFRERVWAIRKEFQARNFPNLIEACSYFLYNYPEYRGGTENKFKTLSEYKFSLVIENENDWITEKIFDAIVAGTVPIYFGPDLAEIPILDKCSISLPASNKGLHSLINGDIEKQYNLKKDFINKLNFNETEWGIFSVSENVKKLLNIILDNSKLIEN